MGCRRPPSLPVLTRSNLCVHILGISSSNKNIHHIRAESHSHDLILTLIIAGRNINNLRYADDTTLAAESEEKLTSLLMRVKKESEKAGLKFNIKKIKIMASNPIISWQIEGEKWKQWQIFISWVPKSLQTVICSHKIKRCLLLGRKAMIKLDSILKSRDIKVSFCQQRSK